MITDRLIAKVAATGVAALFTVTILAGIDTLATEQHAATVIAKAQQQQQQSAPAHTAGVKPSARRS
jgi:hypothetical protein